MTAALIERWRAAWPAALEAWSAYTLLRDPRFLESQKEAGKDGMQNQIAAIRLRDHAVMINVAEIESLGLKDHALAILAHEIGHHVYVPGNLTDNARLIASMARILAGLPADTVHLAANLYSDLLINDRLQHRGGIDMAGVYRVLAASASRETTSVWRLYTRAYEQLWRLPAGTLGPADADRELDADAVLVARIIRAFAGDWLRGARRFAAVLYPYFAKDQAGAAAETFRRLGLEDTKSASRPMPGEAGADTIPDGLAEFDEAELDDGDDLFGDVDDPLETRKAKKKTAQSSPNAAPTTESKGRPGAQARTPFQYGQLLESLGLNVDQNDVTRRYYRDRALPHLIPFPSRRAPHATEPLAEGTESWGAGEPLEALDILQSVSQSPILVPGVTTVQRVYGESPGDDPARTPIDLDIYIDCSGSMPNPSLDVSYLALCGTILAMSALRAGARVQATLWSSAGTFETTGGFIRDEKRVVGTVCGYVSGGTAFPVHILRDTYEARKPSDPPAHIVVISDDGCDTMLAKDEKGNDGAKVAAMALERARGGGTLVLNLPSLRNWRAREPLEAMGYHIHAVQDWEALVAFSRAFVRETYGEG